VENLNVSQAQTFNWAKEKISKKSRIPSLKTILFLLRQISLTIAIYILPNPRFTAKSVSKHEKEQLS